MGEKKTKALGFVDFYETAMSDYKFVCAMGLSVIIMAFMANERYQASPEERQGGDADTQAATEITHRFFSRHEITIPRKWFRGFVIYLTFLYSFFLLLTPIVQELFIWLGDHKAKPDGSVKWVLPLMAGLTLTGVIPSTPVVNLIERKFRKFSHWLAGIPGDVHELVASISNSRFIPNVDLEDLAEEFGKAGDSEIGFFSKKLENAKVLTDIRENIESFRNKFANSNQFLDLLERTKYFEYVLTSGSFGNDQTAKTVLIRHDQLTTNSTLRLESILARLRAESTKEDDLAMNGELFRQLKYTYNSVCYLLAVQLLSQSPSSKKVVDELSEINLRIPNQTLVRPAYENSMIMGLTISAVLLFCINLMIVAINNVASSYDLGLKYLIPQKVQNPFQTLIAVALPIVAGVAMYFYQRRGLIQKNRWYVSLVLPKDIKATSVEFKSLLWASLWTIIAIFVANFGASYISYIIAPTTKKLLFTEAATTSAITTLILFFMVLLVGVVTEEVTARAIRNETSIISFRSQFVLPGIAGALNTAISISYFSSNDDGNVGIYDYLFGSAYLFLSTFLLFFIAFNIVNREYNGSTETTSGKLFSRFRPT